MQQVDPVQFPELYSNVVIHDPLITITNQGYSITIAPPTQKLSAGRANAILTSPYH